MIDFTQYIGARIRVREGVIPTLRKLTLSVDETVIRRARRYRFVSTRAASQVR